MTTCAYSPEELTGYPILHHLLHRPQPLYSADVAQLLGASSVKGLGSRLRPCNDYLQRNGVRLDEAIVRKNERRRSRWLPGPRAQQAYWLLERGLQDLSTSRADDASHLVNAPEDGNKSILILRSLLTTCEIIEYEGGLPHLIEEIDDEDIPEPGESATNGLFTELFIHDIRDDRGRSRPIPEGYGEHGIRVRGVFDYAHTHVAAATGSGRLPGVIAAVCNAVYAERRLVLKDPVRQLEAARRSLRFSFKETHPDWKTVHQEPPLRYANWIASPYGRRAWHHHRSAPPLALRLRCWYTVTLEDDAGRRYRVAAEGYRGDPLTTARRALARLRARQGAKADRRPMRAMALHIAKRQPRPMP